MISNHQNNEALKQFSSRNIRYWSQSSWSVTLVLYEGHKSSVFQSAQQWTTSGGDSRYEGWLHKHVQPQKRLQASCLPTTCLHLSAWAPGTSLELLFAKYSSFVTKVMVHLGWQFVLLECGFQLSWKRKTKVTTNWCENKNSLISRT